MARVVAVSNYGQCRDGPGETPLEASDTICMLDSSFVDRLCSGKVLDIWPHEPCGGRYVITYGHFGARAQLKLPPPLLAIADMPSRERAFFWVIRPVSPSAVTACVIVYGVASSSPYKYPNGMTSN